MASQLQKLAVIEIDGQTYDLAANGHGALVTYEEDEINVYTGQPIPRIIDLSFWCAHANQAVVNARVQGLLDCLAAAYRQLQSARDSKLGVGRDRGEGGA